MKLELVHHNLSKTTVDRLGELIRYMEKVPTPRKFNMNNWFQHSGKNHRHPEIVEGKPITAKGMHKCGTSACAMGWACTNPKFMKMGLKMTYAPEEISGVMFYLDGQDMGNDAGELAMEFFDLDENQMRHLFGGNDEIVTPKDWVARARYFLQTDGLGR